MESPLSKNLKFLLQERGVSLSQLAQETETSPSTLHGYLNGVYPQSLRIVQLVAGFFSVSVDELLMGNSLEKKLKSLGRPFGGRTMK